MVKMKNDDSNSSDHGGDADHDEDAEKVLKNR